MKCREVEKERHWFSSMQKKILQKSEKRKKRQIRKGRKKKEEKKYSLSPSWL